MLIARYGASLGRLCWGLAGAYNVALAKVNPNKEIYTEFLRCYLSQHKFVDELLIRGTRSAQAGFNQSDIESITLNVPSDEVLKDFESENSIIFRKRLLIKKENRLLAEIRDALLPKLISGEILLS